jgi:hypothetical protein
MGTQTLSVGPHPEIEIEHVGGDLVIEGWDRSEIEVRGDDLNPVQHEGQSVNISCGGDLHLAVPRGASLDLSEVGGDLKIENVSGTIDLSFVGGNANLENLTGEVSVSGVVGDLRMKNVNNASVEPARDGAGTDLSERIRRKMEAASQRAQQHAERATRRAEQKMARSMSRQAGHHGSARRWKVGFDSSFASKAKQPVSDEERMSILKMLQEKKITSEQAEKLLAALEGGE